MRACSLIYTMAAVSAKMKSRVWPCGRTMGPTGIRLCEKQSRGYCTDVLKVPRCYSIYDIYIWGREKISTNREFKNQAMYIMVG
jgi:hypothetical protein